MITLLSGELAGRLAREVSDACLQYWGGMGYTWDNPVSRAWRDGRLYAKSGADAARFPGYLDDYALLLDALLEMLQCRWSERDLAWAIVLAESLLDRFQDRKHGGFFFTAHDHETLIQRPKPFTDEALRKIGAAWTEALIAHAAERRKGA